MKSFLAAVSVFLAPSAWAALNVPLTVQEALYAGGPAGVARTNEPFCMGVPLADAAAVKSATALSLSGANAAQFRVLGVWPSGNIKWVQVCGVIPTLAAGGQATVTLTDSGSTAAASPLASDNGATIAVSTGVAAFTVKKSGFNVIDQAVVNGKTIVSSGKSQGLVLTGPDPAAAYPGNVTCSPDPGGSTCSTVYSSANDTASSCGIEENGPVRAVVRCAGNHVDNAGHPYMQYTARLYFYTGKSSVAVTSVLRNANYDTSSVPSPDRNGSTFNTAYKGFASYELRVAPQLSGAVNYTIGTDAAPQSGALSSSDSVYLYQAQSKAMINHEAGDTSCSYQSPCLNEYTPDTGFRIAKNGSTLVTGAETQYPQGWADASDSTGAGVELGMYQLAAQFPASLEFNAGGTDARIGLFARENSRPVYQAWPAWSIHSLYLNFHASALTSPASEFVRFQQYLVARAPYTYYNSTNVFPYPLADPAAEDAYYQKLAATATPAIGASNFCWTGKTPCTPDRAVDPQLEAHAMNLTMTRAYGWSAGGPANQEEFRWSDMLRFLQRGQTGRYLNSAHFYQFQAEKVWPHADGVSRGDSTVNGFTWRSRPPATSGGNQELDGYGRPYMGGCAAIDPGGSCAQLTNSSRSFVSWPDPLHMHWYGMPDYYFLSGDETIREALTPAKDYYMNPNTYQGCSGGVCQGYSRSIGIELMAASRLAEYLQATGDTDASAVLDQAVTNYNLAVKPEGCVNGSPSGCTSPSLYGTDGVDGVSRTRGLHQGHNMRGTWCPAADGVERDYRVQSSFQESILIEGLLSLRRAKGSSWSDYNTALDLAYGMGQWGLTEGFSDDGTATWQGSDARYNGFRYGITLDLPQVCPAGTPLGDWQGHTMLSIGGNIYDHGSVAAPTQGMWFSFYIQYLMHGGTDWQRKFNIAMDQIAAHQSSFPADFGGYQVAALIATLNSSSAPVLQDVPFTVQDNGSGSYTLSWTVPNSAQSYRIKWSPKVIAPSTGLLSFDHIYTNKFGLDPATYSTWFASNNVTEPAPLAPGSRQSFVINAGASGLAAANFSVKAYIAGASATPAGTASTLVMVSGSGQTGTAGQPLAAPFTVKVTDAQGNAVSGAMVTFAVTGGGGSISATSVATDGLGLASSTLTLGAAGGANTVTASAGSLTGSPVTFSATAASATTAAATLSIVSGNGQTGVAGQSLASPFTVKLTDSAGSPVAGVTVTFTVTSGGGTLSTLSVATNSAGTASSTLTLGATAGVNMVSASAGSLAGSAVTFSATGTSAGPGPATTLGIVSGSGQTGMPGQPLASPFSVKVTDAQGNAISGVTVSFAVTAGGGAVSATSVSTNSAGVASTSLTLGSAVGVNTVTASAGSLAGGPITFTATAISASSVDVTWTQLTKNSNWPGGNGYLTILFDPVSQQTILYGIPSASTSIYSTDLYFYNSATGVWTHGPGNGSLTDGCSPGSATVPADRHPVAQMAIDTNRNLMWMYGGVCNNRLLPDMWYLRLNADPSTDTWQNATPAHIPTSNLESAMIYDPDDDVLFTFGYDGGSGSENNWVYCRTTENPIPGTPTAKQRAAGCVRPDDWNKVNVAGGKQPTAWSFPGMVYDTVTKKAIMYGGTTSGSDYVNETWAYDVPTQTWTRKALATTPPPIDPSFPMPSMTYNSITHKVLYHQTSTGSDWQYDPVADTWTKLVSSGNVTPNILAIAHDSKTNTLIGWKMGSSAEMQLGSMSGSTPAVAPSGPGCDVNRDGLINVLDVQVAVRQALGQDACGTADINGDGVCNALDVQSVINASLGGACK